MAKVIQDMTDEELVQQCSNNDLRAYNELVERYAPRLCKLGQKILKDTFAAEELAMDLLLNIWERRHTIIVEGNISAYLFRAFRNMAIRYLRKSLPEMIELEQVENSILVAARNADYEILAKEAEEHYNQNLNKLSPQRRLVFELSREQNLSYADIAKQTNLSVNTVENYMSAALATMRKQYREVPGTLVLFLPAFQYFLK